MVGGHYACTAGVGQRFAADLLDRGRGATHSPQRRGTERDDDPGLEPTDLGNEPDTAGLDMAQLRSLVQPPLTARLPIEVLHRIGDEYFCPRDVRFSEQLIQYLARRPHKRASLAVLGIARLLAPQHNLRFAGTLARHRLSGALPQFTAPAGLRSFALGRGRRLRWTMGSHGVLYNSRKGVAVGARWLRFSSLDESGGAAFRLEHCCLSYSRPVRCLARVPCALHKSTRR